MKSFGLMKIVFLFGCAVAYQEMPLHFEAPNLADDVMAKLAMEDPVTFCKNVSLQMTPDGLKVNMLLQPFALFCVLADAATLGNLPEEYYGGLFGLRNSKKGLRGMESSSLYLEGMESPSGSYFDYFGVVPKRMGFRSFNHWISTTASSSESTPEIASLDSVQIQKNENKNKRNILGRRDGNYVPTRGTENFN
eukprot:Trichotokara_eunicae@DN1552_c0_g1_i4.p1